MRLFRRIVALGSMSAAGRDLRLSPGAVSQRLKALESRFGAPLLTRSTRAITLTPEGRLFLESAERVLSEVEGLETSIEAGKGPLKGTLRISAPSDLGRQYVAPLVVDFAAANPRVQPELYLMDDVADLVSGAIDVAFRYGKLDDSTLISRPLVPNGRVVVGSPAYLAEHGVPKHPNDLSSHRCLVLVRNGEKMPWVMTAGAKRLTARIDAGLSTNDGGLLRLWALEGLGLAFKSYVDVAADIEAGRLITVLSPYTPGNVGLHLIFPSARSAVPRLRAFINFSVARFRELSSGLTRV
ncbi:MAG: LysR family transcriptional regulator [Hyphomicrobiaceae bacterium]|nr:LysR family transcriptional regulator [Hyphomicrobiaceae bacterium]